MRPKSTPKNAVQIITRYMCRFCGQQFQNLSEMQNHSQLHFSEKPPHACYVCGRTYRTPSKLQRHVRVHSGERPYACSICGKRFTRSDHVKQHLKVHMPQRQKNVCRLCGMRFMRRQTLQAHLRSHGVIQVFSCNRCGEAFDSALQLHHHKQTHNSVFYGQSNDDLDAEGGLPISIKREPGDEGNSEDCRPILGLAKFGLGPQPDVKEGLDGQVSEESNNPVLQAKRALDLVLKAQEEPGYSEGNPRPENGHSNADGDSKPAAEEEACVINRSEGGDEEDGDARISFSGNYLSGIDSNGISGVKTETSSDGMKMILIPSTIDDDDDDKMEEESNEDDDKIAENNDDDDSATKDDSEDKSLVSSTGEEVTSSVNHARSSENLLSLLHNKPSPTLIGASMNKESYVSNPSTTFSSMRSLLTSDTVPRFPFMMGSEPSLACMGIPGLSSATAGGKSSAYLFGKKMVRCDHCCIWFEDQSMSLLHMSLHSADPSDPFTCRKCLKRLGNRLEFMAHIVWHLDPSMEETNLKNS